MLMWHKDHFKGHNCHSILNTNVSVKSKEKFK